MTDPIADLLTRIRNALHARHEKVLVPSSATKVAIVEILKAKGYIDTWQLLQGPVHAHIEIGLRYTDKGMPTISTLKRVSSPGCRVYGKAKNIRPVLSGRGLAIYSTPKGVMSGEEAKRLGVGGEFLCQLW